MEVYAKVASGELTPEEGARLLTRATWHDYVMLGLALFLLLSGVGACLYNAVRECEARFAAEATVTGAVCALPSAPAQLASAPFRWGRDTTRSPHHFSR